MTPRKKFAWSVSVLQIFFIVIFAIFVKYGPDLDAADTRHNKPISEGGQDPRYNSIERNYPYFQDMNAMVFVGIGYLYAFLRKYGYTGVTMNFLLCAICVQWGIIARQWWQLEEGKIRLDIISLFKGEFAAASGVIALGGIFGKVGYLQMIVFVLLEVLAYSTAYHCCHVYLQVSDVGESVALHLFAAIFGCSAAYVIDRKVSVQGSPHEAHSYNSQLFCMLGSLILWIFWPSFNAAGDEGDSQHRNVINTFFGLLGSGLSCFSASALLNKENKMSMGHIQNGVLAGAVGVGSVANLMIQPFGALLIGAISGFICVAGFKYFTPFLAKLNLYDPCGISSLHGLPGLFGGVLSILATFIATEDIYGFSLYKFYPAMAPPDNTTTLLEKQFHSPRTIEPGMGRTAQSQAIYQCVYIIVVMLSSCVSGLFTGIVVRMEILDPIEDKQMYLDEIMFDMSDIEISEMTDNSENRETKTTTR